jgi:hypothetical protein
MSIVISKLRLHSGSAPCIARLQQTYSQSHEDQESLPSQPIQQDWRHHYDKEIPGPMRRNADGRAPGADFEGKNLRALLFNGQQLPVKSAMRGT